MIKWTATKDEIITISKIAKRAVKMLPNYKLMHANMDIEAVHCNGNPLRLDDLLDASDMDFAHDISGIWLHIDRTTGQLTGCFSPRYSR